MAEKKLQDKSGNYITFCFIHFNMKMKDNKIYNECTKQSMQTATDSTGK